MIELPSSFQLVELRDRRLATTVPFEKAAPDIRRALSYQRLMGQSVHYFVFQVLPQAFFYPVDLFDPELKKLGYLRTER